MWLCMAVEWDIKTILTLPVLDNNKNINKSNSPIRAILP